MLYLFDTSHSKRLLACLIGLRLLNAIYLRTFAYPDEHWQALEVAHRSAFGYGYLTWEWREGIRSVLHPAVFAGLYRLLDLLGLSDTELLASSQLFNLCSSVDQRPVYYAQACTRVAGGRRRLVCLSFGA
jgi:hypothetical protein